MTMVKRSKVVEILVEIAEASVRAYSPNLLAKLTGGNPDPTCCMDSHSGCLFNSGKTDEGQLWQACYYPGTEQIFDYDVAAMDCIINLHYTQEDACIDVAGSMCANGYGGGLMRGQMGWAGKNQKADQISAQDSRTFQAAAASMANVKIDYAKGENAAISLVTVSSENGLLTNLIMFDGHKGSDC